MNFKEKARAILDGKSLSSIEPEKMSSFVQLAEELAKTLPADKKSDSVSAKQVRILLAESAAATSRIKRHQTVGSAKDIDKDAVKEAALMKIALVYAVAREKNNMVVQGKLVSLKDCSDVLLDSVKSFEDFKIFRKFTEAVMAYFKFHGGN